MSHYYPELVSLNPGAAFGLPVPWQISFLVGVVALAFIYFLKRQEHLKMTWYIHMFMAGTIANMIDRIWHKYVIDFISIGFWPSFNLADSFLCISIAYIIYYHLTD